jgi:ketosteroid isomerase-like protein
MAGRAEGGTRSEESSRAILHAAMLARNLEIVQAFFDAWNRGAWDEALEGASPDVEFDMSANAGEWRGVHVGTDQVKRMFDRFVEPWESVRLDLHKCIDAGDRAVTHHSGHFVGRDGIRAEVQAGWGWTFHDGLLTRVVAYHDPDEALATVEPREPQKIEIIRAALDAWNRGDWDGALKDATPDFEFDNSTVTGEWHGVHKGPDEVKRMWATFAEPWRALANMGFSEFKQGHLPEARKHLTQALEFRRDYWPATLTLAQLELQEGRRLDAIAHLKQVLALKPGPAVEAEANYRMAEIYISLGKRHEALGHLTTAQAKTPEGVWGKRSEEYLKLLR